MTDQQQASQYTAALLRIEQAAVRAVVADYLYRMAMMRRQARGAVVLRGAETAAQTIARELEAQAGDLIDGRRIERAADLYAAQAVDLATGYAGAAASLEPDPVAAHAMQAAIATAEDKLRVGVKLLQQAETPVAIESALKVATAAAANIATGAEYSVNVAANAAIWHTAAREGARLIWRDERDACVVCLALAGHTVDPSEGEAFDEFATFDPTHSPTPVWPPGMPLTYPPRHPHCRCWVEVWRGSAAGLVDLSQALRREALRSALRGWSLPSESNAARLRAAEHVLRSGLADSMPKSVRAEGERAVGRGRFTTRSWPHRGSTIG